MQTLVTALLTLVLIALVLGIPLVAMIAAIGLLLPAPVERARLKLESSLGKALLLGLVNFLSLVAINAAFEAWWAASKPPTLVWVILQAVLILAYIGLLLPGIPALVALAQLVGMRMGESKSPWRRDLRGGALLFLACLTPYVGWFIFAPAVLSMAIGAGLMTFFPRRAPKGGKAA